MNLLFLAFSLSSLPPSLPLSLSLTPSLSFPLLHFSSLSLSLSLYLSLSLFVFLSLSTLSLPPGRRRLLLLSLCTRCRWLLCMRQWEIPQRAGTVYGRYR